MNAARTTQKINKLKFKNTPSRSLVKVESGFIPLAKSTRSEESEEKAELINDNPKSNDKNYLPREYSLERSEIDFDSDDSWLNDIEDDDNDKHISTKTLQIIPNFLLDL